MSSKHSENGKKFSKKNFYHDLKLQIVKALNIAVMTALFGYTWFQYYSQTIYYPFYRVGNWVMVLLFIMIYFMYGRTYDALVVSLSPVSEKVYSQLLAILFSDGIMYLVILMLTRHIPRVIPLLVCFVIQGIFALIWSVLAYRWYFHEFPPRKTVVVYDDDPSLADLGNMINRYGLDNKFAVEKTYQVLDVVNDLTVLNEFDVVFLANIHSHQRNQLIKYCVNDDKQIYILPRIGDVIMSGAERMHMLHLPFMHLARYSPRPEFYFFKRLFDLTASLALFILTSPFFLIVALLIKFFDNGPVFYKQVRLTKNGKEFKVIKFRSMRVDAEKDGVARLSTGDDDDRITPVGKFLRKVRLDELPQLLNIIKGDMSIVGPRPERPEIAAEYEESLPEFSLRLQAKAGLTGYAQVYGKYNTTPYNKLEMDLMYIANPSIFEDLRIIFATIKILFQSESTEGIEEGQETAQKK